MVDTDPYRTPAGDTDGKTSNSRKGGFLNGVKNVSLWFVLPYMFNRKDANPLGNVSQPIRSIDKPKERQPFKDMNQVMADNPDFEAVRERAMQALKVRLWVMIFGALVWIYVGYLTDIADLFPLPLMNGSLKFLYSIVVFGFVFVTDFQLTVFKYRVVGLTFWRYLRFRLGGK